MEQLLKFPSRDLQFLLSEGSAVGGGEEQDGLPTASLSAIVTETRRITGQLWREETETTKDCYHHQ